MVMFTPKGEPLPNEPSALDLAAALHALLDWEVQQGGYEAPAWQKAKELLGRQEKEPEHSPAPWQELDDVVWLGRGTSEKTGEAWYRFGVQQRHISIQDANGLPVCLVVADEDDESARSNVELIKRAPGLLELLEHAIPLMDRAIDQFRERGLTVPQEFFDLIDDAKRQALFARSGAP